MHSKFSYLKATVLGGIVFLLPVAVFLIVIGKLVVGLKAVAGRLAPFLPVNSVGGFVVLNLVACPLSCAWTD